MRNDQHDAEPDQGGGKLCKENGSNLSGLIANHLAERMKGGEILANDKHSFNCSNALLVALTNIFCPSAKIWKQSSGMELIELKMI
jgi:hypothetical protein